MRVEDPDTIFKWFMTLGTSLRQQPLHVEQSAFPDAGIYDRLLAIVL
jgi:hypothetical protein